MGGALFRKDCFDTVEGEEKILARLRSVALETCQEIDLAVGLAVRCELLKFPFAVANVWRIGRAPAGPFLHDREADQITSDEPPVLMLDGIALRVELGQIFDHRDHGAARDWLSVTQRLDRGRGRVELAILRRIPKSRRRRLLARRPV